MDSTPTSGSEFVYRALEEAGVELLIGLPGTQTLPLDRAVVGSQQIDYVMARHETAIPHVAWGHYEAGGGVAATLTVPGPGDTNVMHGLKNAAEDCVPILHFSPHRNPEDRGKKPIHEIEPETFDSVVKDNINVERPIELPAAIARAIERSLSAPMGPIRIGVPTNVLEAERAFTPAEFEEETTTYDLGPDVERAAEALGSAASPALYVGGGARRSPGGPDVVRRLATALDAPVLTSYKGKGVLAEDSEYFLGVAGSHLPTASRDVLDAADVVLALGTDFDGVATDHWELPFGDTLVHVTLDTDHIDQAYTADIPIVADVTEAGEALLGELDGGAGAGWDGGAVASAARATYRKYLEEADLTAETSPLRTPAVLETVREATPRDAVVTADVGGFRLWAMQAFRTYEPDQYVAAGSWAGMGVGLPAAIGAALANPEEQVICLTGDGGLMMCIHELHTAAQENLDIVTVVSQNDDYGIISKSPKIAEHTEGHRFTWDAPDFVGIAESFGGWGTRVDTVAGLRSSLEEALARDDGVPKLIAVDVETEEPSAGEAGADSPGLDPGVLAGVTED